MKKEAKGLAECSERTDYWKDRFRIFKNAYSQNASFLLDVGCGDGGFVVLSALKGLRPIFCDYQSKHVRTTLSEVRERSLSAEGVVADARFLPFKEETFDLVTCIEVLEHLGEEKGVRGRDFLLDIRRALRDFERIVKQGSYIFVLVPNRMFPLEIHAKIPFGNYLPWYIKRRVSPITTHYFSRIELANLFSNKGFTVLRSGYWTRNKKLSKFRISIPLPYFGIYLLAMKPKRHLRNIHESVKSPTRASILSPICKHGSDIACGQ